MRKIILTCGIPGSGKTTWCLEQLQAHPGQFKHVTKDALRTMLDGGKWTGGNEKFVLRIRDTIILEALKAGKDVLVDDTGFEPHHMEHLTALVRDIGISTTFEIKVFDTPLQECLDRDAKRANGVGASVILNMYHKYCCPPPGSYPHTEGLPTVLLVDLDGTLSLGTHRSPYDASTCDRDEVCVPVRNMVGALWSKGIQPIFLSGREERYRSPTIYFLRRAFDLQVVADVWERWLLMRPTGDNRRDSIVKRELFDRHIRGTYNVIGVVDDRVRVIRECWRPLGVFVFDVGGGMEY